MIATLPPPGIEKVPQAGVAEPAAGFVTAVRLAPPARTMPLVDAYVSPAGSGSETTEPVAAARPAAFATVIV